jgi:hypothetical protein
MDPRTAEALNTFAPDHVAVKLDPARDDDYFRVFAEAWATPGDLIVIEQDILLTEGVIEQFLACRNGWCGNPYNIAGQQLVCLGCTRFTAELKDAHPDLLDVVGLVNNDGLPAKDWRRLDVRLSDELHFRGFQVHTHTPEVEHFHRYE